MTRSIHPLDWILATIVGCAAVVVVFLAFVAHDVVIGGRHNMATGIGVLFGTILQPSFLLAALIAFALAFYEVVR